MKTLKWFDGGKSNNSTEEKKEHDHPMTVEFPSPVEDNDGHSASSSVSHRHHHVDTSKLQSTNNGHHDNNNNSSLHVENNNRSNLLRRISEGDSEERDQFEHPSSFMPVPVPYRNNHSDNDNNDSDDSIAGGRYGARPSMRCSTSSMEEEDIVMMEGGGGGGESKIDNDHPNNSINRAIVPTSGSGSKQRKSMTTSIIGRSASTGTVGSSSKPMVGGGAVATGVAVGGSANSGSGSNSTPTFQRKGSGGMNNNNNEREEEDDDYDVRAAFETEHKGELYFF